jgi:hypothetical protein
MKNSAEYGPEPRYSKSKTEVAMGWGYCNIGIEKPSI